MTRTGDEARGRRRRVLGYVVLWLVTAVVAVSVGVVAVTSVGASFRGRGPLGNEAIRTADLERPGTPTLDPAAVVTRRSVDGEWGSVVVECRGTLAVIVDTAGADGWQVVSLDPGPDDDVDAVFNRGAESLEVEVFCNRGEPTVAEVERNVAPDDPDDDLADDPDDDPDDD